MVYPGDRMTYGDRLTRVKYYLETCGTDGIRSLFDDENCANLIGEMATAGVSYDDILVSYRRCCGYLLRFHYAFISEATGTFYTVPGQVRPSLLLLNLIGIRVEHGTGVAVGIRKTHEYMVDNLPNYRIPATVAELMAFRLADWCYVI